LPTFPNARIKKTLQGRGSPLAEQQAQNLPGSAAGADDVSTPVRPVLYQAHMRKVS
jgi:hypothetical protein